MSRLFVSNLPENTKEKTLRELFTQKGNVTDCSLKFTKDGKFRKFAFIGYKTEEEAKEAQRYFNKTFLKSSRIQVDFAVDLGEKKSRPWSKYSNAERTQSQEKATITKEKDTKLKQKKEEKDAALLGELKDDQEFQEFMGAFDLQNRQVWKNNMPSSTSLIDNCDDDRDNHESEQTDEKPMDSNDKKNDDEKKKRKVSDIEFLKSKMKLLASDTEEEENEKATETNPEKGTSEKFVLKMKGLPATVKESAIREFFKPLKVKVTMPRNKNKLAIGIAFVQCSCEKDLKAALVKNKTFIGKKKVFLSQVFEKIAVDKRVEEKPKPWEQKEKALEGEESIAEVCIN